MRTVVEINADLDAVHREMAALDVRHAGLLDERKAAVKVRDRSIIRDFEAGHTVKRIAADLNETQAAVWSVLVRNGRSAKDRGGKPISHLPADQQRAYHKARRMGHGPGVARQMATLSTRGAEEPAVSVGQ